MKMSESIKEISAVLPKAQAAIKSAIKSATNPHFGSRYADLATVIEACRAALNDNGITFLQPVRATERGVIVETILLHTSAEWISEELELPVAKQDAQGVGSAITYGKRYGLQSLVGIPSEDDDGNAATAKSKAEGAAEPPPPVSRKMKPADFQAHCTAFSNATTREGLQEAYTNAVMAARKIGDTEAERSFMTKKDEAKSFLETVKRTELASQA